MAVVTTFVHKIHFIIDARFFLNGFQYWVYQPRCRHKILILTDAIIIQGEFDFLYPIIITRLDRKLSALKSPSITLFRRRLADVNVISPVPTTIKQSH